MLVDWLYRTTLEVSLLIGLVLLIRPVARRVFGARAAYWLWFIPLIRVVLVDRLEWPRSVVETIGAQGGELAIEIYPSPEVWTLPSGVAWDEVWIAGLLSWAALRIVGAIRFRRALAAQSTLLELPAELAAMVPHDCCGTSRNTSRPTCRERRSWRV
jgi:beta-lactamase regulating signal transducer with metallopeptidase domain